VVGSAHSLTILSIVAPWRKSRRRSSRWINGTQSPDLSTRKATRKRSLPGRRTSARSFLSSTCVPSSLGGYREALIVHSQTELALNTNTIVSGVDHNVTKILDIVSSTGGAGVRICEGSGCENLLAGITCSLFITERTLTVAQTRIRSATSTTSGSSI
jgi:hypothetical protein